MGSPLKPAQSHFAGILCTVSFEKQNAKNKNRKPLIFLTFILQMRWGQRNDNTRYINTYVQVDFSFDSRWESWNLVIFSLKKGGAQKWKIIHKILVHITLRTETFSIFPLHVSVMGPKYYLRRERKDLSTPHGRAKWVWCLQPWSSTDKITVLTHCWIFKSILKRVSKAILIFYCHLKYGLMLKEVPRDTHLFAHDLLVIAE